MRKLATIRQIEIVEPIPNADNIEKATIDGWQVVVKKGEFRPLDKCIFYEVDSFLPDVPQYEFLQPKRLYNNITGYRLKTVKLRKTLSQGLVLPLSVFAGITKEIGADVTEYLGVIKYDTSLLNVKVHSEALGTFPEFIPKTDQERIQNLTHLFETNSEDMFEETLKLNGTSMTVYVKELELPWYKTIINKFIKVFPTTHFGVCSRNRELRRNNSAYWKIAEQFIPTLPSDYAFQGELCGPKIQGNYEKLDSYKFFIFDVFDIRTQEYLRPDDVHSLCAKLGLAHVPLMNSASRPLSKTLPELLASVEGHSIDNSVVSEGRVFKSLYSDLTFKVINNKYLLKEK